MKTEFFDLAIKPGLLKGILRAKEALAHVAEKTPLQLNKNLSEQYGANIFLKREDRQITRSYKLRGAYNKISLLSSDEKRRGVVCASAGNHAQGVAYACELLKIKCTVFMPQTTPLQKVDKVKQFGREFTNVILTGDTFDDANKIAVKFANENKNVFVHPFEDEKVMAGQGTVALEILEQADEKIDFIFIPVGGGGLASGIATVFKQISPNTKLIGVEPLGAPSMKTAFENGKATELKHIDRFIDGAAVKRVGDATFEVCNYLLDDMVLVPEGKVCTTLLKLFNEEGMILEPAGALSIAGLDQYQKEIKGKNAVCIASGGNHDITRTEEIRERSMLYEGLKHYFSVEFAQRPGALKEFVTDVLGAHDDITYFQFSKKNNREKGPAVIGIELHDKAGLEGLFFKMNEAKIKFRHLNPESDLLQMLT